MKLLKRLTFASCALLLAANSSQAFEVISAQDTDKEAGNRHATLNQTLDAQNSFLSKLSDSVGTEDFESLAWATSSNVNLSFPGAGTATLSGDGRVYSIEHIEGVTNQSTIERELRWGRYASSGTNYWQVRANVDSESTFTINFSEDIAAFGFYSYDLGDFGGDITIELLKDDIVVGNIDNATYQFYDLQNSGSSTGSAIYVGIVGENLDGSYETFDQVRFVVINDDGTKYDEFAFDDMTIATAGQLMSNPPEVNPPEVNPPEVNPPEVNPPQQINSLIFAD